MREIAAFRRDGVGAGSSFSMMEATMIRPREMRLCAWAAVFVALTATTSWGVLTHQYTFNDGTANDAIGGAHGTLVNGATVAAGQLQLANPNFSGPSTAGRYLSLPPTILPASGSVTIE
jgi:hypothetical protein